MVRMDSPYLLHQKDQETELPSMKMKAISPPRLLAAEAANVKPKKYKSEFIAISEGEENRNAKGFWLEGTYTTYVNEKGRS